MILKVKTENGWAIYDNFEKVYYRFMLETELAKFIKEPTANAVWIDPKEKTGVYIIATKRSIDQDKFAGEYSIAATGRVYLCNDNGKTIERIN